MSDFDPDALNEAIRRIGALHGPVTLDQFMQQALWNAGARMADDSTCDLCGRRGVWSSPCRECLR